MSTRRIWLRGFLFSSSSPTDCHQWLWYWGVVYFILSEQSDARLPWSFPGSINDNRRHFAVETCRWMKGWEFSPRLLLGGLGGTVRVVRSEVRPGCHIPQFGVYVCLCVRKREGRARNTISVEQIINGLILIYVVLEINWWSVCACVLCDWNGWKWKPIKYLFQTYTVSILSLTVFICTSGEMGHWEMMKLQLSCHQSNLFPWWLYQMACHPWDCPICLFRSHKYCLPQVCKNKAILNLLSDCGKTTGRLVLILVLYRHVGVNWPSLH